MPLCKAPTLTPGRFADDGLDFPPSEECQMFGNGARSNDRPNAVRLHGSREEFFFMGSKPECY